MTTRVNVQAPAYINLTIPAHIEHGIRRCGEYEMSYVRDPYGNVYVTLEHELHKEG